MKIKKIPIPSTREEWKQNRLNGIGGSDVAAALGMSQYKSPYYLWCEKTGRIQNDVDNEAMRVGRDLEEYVAKRFCEETGKKVRKSNYSYQSVDYPFMLANVDRFVVGESAGLECKTASALNRTRYDKGDVPIQYYLQCMHYMAVTGLKKWYIAILVMGKGFYTYEINRDEEEIKILIERESEFWDCVINDVEPSIDGSASTSEAIETLHPKAKDETIQLIETAELLNRYEELKGLKKKIDDEMNQIVNEVKNEMKDCSTAYSNSWKISWKSVETNKFDTKRFKKDCSELYEKYITTSSSRRFSISKKED